ncbi:MAG TPA: FAD:protein FMN transferase [Verrucomicrobiae bacterium]
MLQVQLIQPSGFGPSDFLRLSAFGFRLLPLLAALLLLAGCRSVPPEKPLERFAFSHPAMGTLISITLYASDPAAAKAAAAAAFQRIDALEDILSDYQADSELMRLCDQPFGTPVPVSVELFEVLQRAQKISQLSDGAFDVTVGPYIRLWRFARKRKVLPTPAEIAAARVAVGWQKLRLDQRARTVTLLVPNMRLDLGSIGKGYAADQALRLLKGRGIDRALVAASGDIAIGNPPPGQRGWKLGIAAFDGSTNAPPRTLLLHNAGISTSGDTEQFIEINGVHYSHIVNPATGLGMTERIQSTVIGPDATTTDSLDTTVSLLGVGRGLALIDSWPHTAALVVTKEGGRTQTFPSRRFGQIPQVH